MWWFQAFKVSLAWTDYPAELTADIVLVNDLDVLVTGPNGEIWAGNNFTGWSDEGEEYPIYDRQNNHEQVHIQPPRPPLEMFGTEGYPVEIFGAPLRLTLRVQRLGSTQSWSAGITCRTARSATRWW